ncbi:hypothetical protein CEXT_148791 [Caerostris extrusa]|uniref:Uncharacterized protein n=1 Tax=Caerostris extrusa TaxID=172846 RepID=A0AAV4RUF5_CAEEX|nr:hypothetical protein CEXT_148791 [Caerostris extrusa]
MVRPRLSFFRCLCPDVRPPDVNILCLATVMSSNNKIRATVTKSLFNLFCTWSRTRSGSETQQDNGVDSWDTESKTLILSNGVRERRGELKRARAVAILWILRCASREETPIRNPTSETVCSYLESFPLGSNRVIFGGFYLLEMDRHLFP